LSPALTLRAMYLPLSSVLPGPTETTLPLVGFSLAESGSTIPLAVLVSASDCLTITRSDRGFSFIARFTSCWARDGRPCFSNFIVTQGRDPDLDSFMHPCSPRQDTAPRPQASCA